MNDTNKKLFISKLFNEIAQSPINASEIESTIWPEMSTSSGLCSIFKIDMQKFNT